MTSWVSFPLDGRRLAAQVPDVRHRPGNAR